MEQKKPRMLIVEDDESVRKSLVRFFGGEGFSVVWAKSARGAHDRMLEHAHTDRFDVVVCDQMMPTHDDGRALGPLGYELCRHIREGLYPGYENIPFFLHTSDPEHPLSVKVEEFDGIIVKKGDTVALLDAIMAALQQTKQP